MQFAHTYKIYEIKINTNTQITNTGIHKVQELHENPSPQWKSCNHKIFTRKIIRDEREVPRDKCKVKNSQFKMKSTRGIPESIK